MRDQDHAACPQHLKTRHFALPGFLRCQAHAACPNPPADEDATACLKRGGESARIQLVTTLPTRKRLSMDMDKSTLSLFI